MPDSAAVFDAFDNVSRETLDDFRRWKALLEQWNAQINLVQRNSLDQFWTRHALDSWQITPFIPDSALNILDLGSGGGFPGLAVAIALKSRGQGRAILVESITKKCAFLREVTRKLELPADIRNARIEDLPDMHVDVVTARAFAPLPRLLGYAQRFMRPDSRAILLKGRDYEAEIEAAKAEFDFDVTVYPSHTDEEGRILVLTNLSRKPQSSP